MAWVHDTTKLVAWVRQQFKIECCRDTIRKVLKRLGFSWKKARKLLNKANTNKKRTAYLETLKGLLQKEHETAGNVAYRCRF